MGNEAGGDEEANPTIAVKKARKRSAQHHRAPERGRADAPAVGDWPRPAPLPERNWNPAIQNVTRQAS